MVQCGNDHQKIAYSLIRKIIFSEEQIHLDRYFHVEYVAKIEAALHNKKILLKTNKFSTFFYLILFRAGLKQFKIFYVMRGIVFDFGGISIPYEIRAYCGSENTENLD